MRACRICSGPVLAFLDLGRQPLSDAFIEPENIADEFFYPLVLGRCEACSMAQLLQEVPRERMFHADYPYRSSGSTVMTAHFTAIAEHFLASELTGPNPFIVEIGSNDGVMLQTVASRGVRHLGVDPASGIGETAQQRGVSILPAFFEEDVAKDIAEEQGPADVVYSANTICHIPYLDSVFAGLDALLADTGIFVFEDPYIGDILEQRSFDQIYDEHFYYFSASSVGAMARRFGLELVDVERLPVHGGEVRYTLARPGRRPVSPAVDELVASEAEKGLDNPATYEVFARDVQTIGDDLKRLLGELKASGKTVAGYGATAKSATVNNFCGIGPDLVQAVYDTTPEKCGRVTPGMHIPVQPMTEFSNGWPDYALLYAWNHADEIIRKEAAFREAGGRWITYVPRVHVL